MQPAPFEDLPDIEYDDLQRLVVLYSNYRSGTNLFKSTLNSIGAISSESEYFSRELAGRSDGFLFFDNYLKQEGVDLQEVISKPKIALHRYFGYLFPRLPKQERYLIDLKYDHAMRFGLDVATQAPALLWWFANWNVPIIYLVRRDHLAQAISNLVAFNTGEYVRIRDRAVAGADRQDPIWLDPQQVLKLGRAYRFARQSADYYLRTVNADYMTVFYEDITGPDSAAVYRRCMNFLGLYREFESEPAPGTARQFSASRVANIDEIMEIAFREAPDLVTSELRRFADTEN